MALPPQRVQAPRHPNLPQGGQFPVPSGFRIGSTSYNPVELAAWLEDISTSTEQEVENALMRVALALETYAKANASGRPGPRAVTGNYRRSIRAETRVSRRGRALSIRVGSDAPQAHRLEYGFYGYDRAGRFYNQPPFPHFGPARARAEEDFRREMEAIVARVRA